MEEKIAIPNRNSQKIIASLDKKKKSSGLVFIVPGLSGRKEELHIQIFKKAFDEKNFTALVFDPGNSVGESYGKLEDVTLTQYLADLEDVINWAKKEEWYQEPFALVGHSLGAFCCLLYAEKHPEKVRAIAPISSAINNNLKERMRTDESLISWKKRGFKETVGHSGKLKKIKWSYMEDVSKYDSLERAGVITMPVLLIVGDKDASTPIEFQERIKKKVRGEVELHVIKGAEHTFREKEHIEEIKGIFLSWIDKNLT